MLDHLRLEAEAVVARIGDVAIDEVAGAVVLEHGPAAQAAGIRLTLAESRIAARADARLLRRALGNLVSNAIRHARGTRILVGARLRDGAVELWVIDDGRGIAAGDVDRLFEDFAQGSDHGLENRGGFGLGLSSARRLIELQRGGLTLDQSPRRGQAAVLEARGESMRKILEQPIPRPPQSRVRRRSPRAPPPLLPARSRCDAALRRRQPDSPPPAPRR